MPSPEDIKLIEEAKQDSKNFQKIYNKYHQKVYNYFWYRNGHDRELAEDMMQETFMKAFRKLSDFQSRGYSYLTYLLTIAHNMLVNHFRDARGEAVELDRVPGHIVDNLDDEVDIDLMWREIYELPLIEREVLLLRYRRELPIREIAQITGKSENAVKLILPRARARLKQWGEPEVLTALPDLKKEYTEPQFTK